MEGRVRRGNSNIITDWEEQGCFGKVRMCLERGAVTDVDHVGSLDQILSQLLKFGS